MIFTLPIRPKTVGPLPRREGRSNSLSQTFSQKRREKAGVRGRSSMLETTTRASRIGRSSGGGLCLVQDQENAVKKVPLQLKAVQAAIPQQRSQLFDLEPAPDR